MLGGGPYIRMTNFFIHTCKIGHYNPSLRITDLVTTPLMLCALTLYMNGGTYSLKSTPKHKFFEELFLAIFIYSQTFCQKSAGRKSPKKYFSYFLLMSGLALEPRRYV